ncbi:hypothetical protein J4H86_24230 [Spiractinospora alimapuensis]|uniref:hypothetical protein n=1 Tax=Spiractinospora alimapuensis TaxID=2820884 RepID=UPI001F288070|nr:hypothetical protein [Spiractinospora alimapuensis]QVQ51836.1 hypothetical protein J4H86_24230 [Spiractinospora alimapuensis]
MAHRNAPLLRSAIVSGPLSMDPTTHGPANHEGGDDMQVLELQALEVPTEEAAIPSSASVKVC